MVVCDETNFEIDRLLTIFERSFNTTIQAVFLCGMSVMFVAAEFSFDTSIFTHSNVERSTVIRPVNVCMKHDVAPGVFLRIMKTEKELHEEALQNVTNGTAILVREKGMFQLIGEIIADKVVFIWWKKSGDDVTSIPMDHFTLSHEEARRVAAFLSRVN